MFKSIKWKLVAMFMLMVAAVIILVGTIFRISLSDFYLDEFSDKVTVAFSGEFYENVVSETEKGNDLAPVLDAYSGRIGIDLYRNMYLLDGKTGKILYRTDSSVKDIEKTPNIISALSGVTGDTLNEQLTYMDYAKPVIVNGKVKYVIYVKDTKEELTQIISTVLSIILRALLVGLLISLIIGYFMSETITSPIISLKSKAERMAAGDFGTRIESKAEDEIGDLTEAFNNMAAKINENLNTISAEKTKLETILKFMTDGVISFDEGGAITHINPAAKSYLGIDESGTDFDEYFEKIGADISMSEIIVKKGETIEREITVNDRQLQAFFTSIAPNESVVSAVIVVVRDVTKLHKLELSRREFVSNVSHELRTPITTIKSYTETILDSEDMPMETARSFLEVVCSEADRMTRLVFDLLELSRLDYDNSSMPKEKFDLKLLLENIVSKLAFEADSHEHKLSLAFAGKMDLFFGNRDRIEQVITNIIVNAVKYTPNGGDIKVSAGQIYGNFYVKVKDNGIGIPEEDLPHVFDRFYRVDKARSRSSGGTGLGLAIAKEIVNAHNGDIKITSEKGKGTEVTLRFPVV